MRLPQRRRPADSHPKRRASPSQSLDSGVTWTLLGVGARVGTTPNWQLTASPSLKRPLRRACSRRRRLSRRPRVWCRPWRASGPPEIAVTGNVTGIADGDSPHRASLTTTDFGGLPWRADWNALHLHHHQHGRRDPWCSPVKVVVGPDGGLHGHRSARVADRPGRHDIPGHVPDPSGLGCAEGHPHHPGQRR